MNGLTWLLAAAAVLMAGCHVDVRHSGPARTEAMSVALDKAEMVRAELRIGVGELSVQGGAQRLMEGDFTFAPESWKPVIKYTNTGVRGLLTLEQPSGTLGGNHENKWDVRLNDSVPLDLMVKFGAGQGRLEVGSLSLRSVEVEIGVGEIRLDLRGRPKRDYNVNVRGGVGQATVYLPGDVGIYANASGGIGSISVHGLRKEGGHWVNDAFEKAGATKIRLDVKGGIGEIKVIAE
jgi:hypothetical protein